MKTPRNDTPSSPLVFQNCAVNFLFLFIPMFSEKIARHRRYYIVTLLQVSNWTAEKKTRSTILLKTPQIMLIAHINDKLTTQAYCNSEDLFSQNCFVKRWSPRWANINEFTFLSLC